MQTEKVRWYVCPWSAKMTAPWGNLNVAENHKWVFTPDDLYHSMIWETDVLSSSANCPVGKSCWIFSVLPILCQKCVDPSSTCHSFWFWFLFVFIIFVVLFLFCCFICLCVLLCFFCVSTPPLLCLQLALLVSTHPSDLIPSCMPSHFSLTH